MKYNDGKVNRLAKITRLLKETDGPLGSHGWTKELSLMWTERNKLTIDVSRMERNK